MHEGQRRGLAFEHGARDEAAFVRGLLRVHPREAVARVRAAAAAGPQLTLTGEPVPAPFEQVSGAQRSGAISARHAQVVVSAVEQLPGDVQAEHGVQLEHPDRRQQRSRRLLPLAARASADRQLRLLGRTCRHGSSAHGDPVLP